MQTLLLHRYNHLKCHRILFVNKIESEPLKIKKRGEDGYKLISVRIKEDTLSKLDKLANETNYSRNELINLILKHGVNNAVIE